MAWEQFIALINLLCWYNKRFQASIQQNPVSSFLHCLFKVTCYPIVCSMSELDSPLKPSCKTFCCKREHSSRNHQNPRNCMFWDREQCHGAPLIRRHCYCPCDCRNAMMSQYITYLFVFFVFVFLSHAFAEVFVLRRRKNKSIGRC